MFSPRETFYAGLPGASGRLLSPPWPRFAFATAVVRTLPLLATFSTGVASAATPLIFFPPDPPVLGTALPARDQPAASQPAAPTELEGYVNECFYAPLAARLTATSPAAKLTDAQRGRLEAYRATKVALQTELRAKIDTLRDADAATREAQLRDFAAAQTARIAGLEQTAEKLRRELVVGADLGGAPAAGEDATRLRYVAFFQEGLSAAQRRLLREAAQESVDPEKPAPGSPSRCLVFSPEGSRIRLPTDLPAELTARIAAYQKEKSALKRELRDAVGGTSRPQEQVFVDLATRQAPRLAALEELADSIRRGVAARKDPARAPDLPPLSPELEARIAAYRRDKLALQKSLLAKVEEVTGGQPPAVNPGNPADLVSTGHASELQEKIREAIVAYTRENAARYASLDQRKVAIRNDLARLAETAAGPSRTPSADILLKKFAESQQELEVWRNYRYYQIAVLQPGLSPEQRRLLFDGAIEQLALPLPGGVALH